jgi:hypothetical protein
MRATSRCPSQTQSGRRATRNGKKNSVNQLVRRMTWLQARTFVGKSRYFDTTTASPGTRDGVPLSRRGSLPHLPLPALHPRGSCRRTKPVVLKVKMDRPCQPCARLFLPGSSESTSPLGEPSRAHSAATVSPGVRYFMCDVVGRPKLMGYAFALFPMWPKLKAAANALPHDLTIMADTEILGPARSRCGSRSLSAVGSRAPRRSRWRSGRSPAPSLPPPPSGWRGRPTTSAPSRPRR